MRYCGSTCFCICGVLFMIFAMFHIWLLIDNFNFSNKADQFHLLLETLFLLCCLRFLIVKKYVLWGTKFAITFKYWYLFIYPSVRKKFFCSWIGTWTIELHQYLDLYRAKWSLHMEVDWINSSWVLHVLFDDENLGEMKNQRLRL